MGALLIRDDAVLLGHRHALRRDLPDCWDVPGGHVKRGETHWAALTRELSEELGIEVDEDPRAADFHLRAQGYDLSLWVVRRFTGEPTNRAPHEHDDIAWFDRATARGLALADRALLEVIELSLASASRN